MALNSKESVLITGSTGFIGKKLVPKLLAAGHNVLAITSDQKKVQSLFGIGSVDIHDYLSSNAIKDIKKFEPQALIHLAWSGLPDYSIENNKSNLQIGINVIDAAVDLGVKKFIGSGSCWEYGSLSGQLKENMGPEDVGDFGNTKIALSNYMINRAQEISGIANWLRLFYVFGEGQREGSVIPSIISSFQNQKPLELNDMNKALDFINVEDVAEIITRVLSKSSESEVINVGSGNPTSIPTLIDIIANSMSINLKNKYQLEIDHKKKSWADIHKISEKFSFNPKVSMKERITDLTKVKNNVRD
jgi:nucleoside-diphosphate-sugar epimerase